MFFLQCRKTFDDILKAFLAEGSMIGRKYTFADERCSHTPICSSCQWEDMYKMRFRMPHEHSWMLALSAQRVSALHISRCRRRILPGALRDSSISFINGFTSTSTPFHKSPLCSTGFLAYSTRLLARNMARRTRIFFSTTKGEADHFRSGKSSGSAANVSGTRNGSCGRVILVCLHLKI